MAYSLNIKNKIKHQIKEQETKVLRLTEDELNAFEGFANLSPLEKEELSDLIYNLSFVLYKSYEDESA